MEQALTAGEILRRLDKEINPYSLGVIESYAEQIRSEEQAKTRETAIEFVKWMDKQGIANLFRDDNKKMDYFDTEKMFDKWFTNKAQQK